MPQQIIENVIIPIEMATAQVNALNFPAVNIGDVVWYENYKFEYTSSGWVIKSE